MSTFFTSDTHFGHQNIIKFCPETRGRFTTVEDMDEALIENWNSLVNPGDLVYHLGDFAFASQGRIKEILSRLNGDIAIVCGNHDKAISKVAFQEHLCVYGLVLAFLPACAEIKEGNQRFILNHYAMRVWNKSHYGSIHLYGHSHGTLPGAGKSVDVGVDSAELSKFFGVSLVPWSLEQILEFMSMKPAYFPDHHNEKTQ